MTLFQPRGLLPSVLLPNFGTKSRELAKCQSTNSEDTIRLGVDPFLQGLGLGVCQRNGCDEDRHFMHDPSHLNTEVVLFTKETQQICRTPENTHENWLHIRFLWNAANLSTVGRQPSRSAGAEPFFQFLQPESKSKSTQPRLTSAPESKEFLL